MHVPQTYPKFFLKKFVYLRNFMHEKQHMYACIFFTSTLKYMHNFLFIGKIVHNFLLLEKIVTAEFN